MTEENHSLTGPTEMESPEEQQLDEVPATEAGIEESGFAEKKKIGIGLLTI